MAPRPTNGTLCATTNHDRHVQSLPGMAGRDLRRLGSGLVLDGVNTSSVSIR
jgi:hypothetical protein